MQLPPPWRRTFFGGDATNPAVGQKGRREDVSGMAARSRLPTNETGSRAKSDAPRSFLRRTGVRHLSAPGDPSRHGQGRIGDLAQPTTLAAFAQLATTQLNATAMQTVGDPSKPIRRVALACGAAGEFLHDASRARADLFLTGELRFHDALAAEAKGVAVIVAGHYATERPAVEDLAGRLATALPDLTDMGQSR